MFNPGLSRFTQADIIPAMTLRQQQIGVFLGTLLVIFGVFAGGIYLVAQRLTREATLQTSLLMARQVEVALAESLRKRASDPSPPPQSSPWSFLGLLFPGQPPSEETSNAPPSIAVKGLMQSYMARTGSIEAMWVLNADGKVLYASRRHDEGRLLGDEEMRQKLQSATTSIVSRTIGKGTYYDVLVPLEMPQGVKGPGGLRLWINPAGWTELLGGLWRQLLLLLVIGGGIAMVSASFTTALYTRRFRLIREALSQAEAGTYRQRPSYSTQDEVAASLDLIDSLVMKQQGIGQNSVPVGRLAVAARTLAHEIKIPVNAMAVQLELLRHRLGNRGDAREGDGADRRSLEVLDTSMRQVDRLVRDFSDYAGPVAMERKPLNLADVLHSSLEAARDQCLVQGIRLEADLPEPPWPLLGDETRLRQAFDNLIRNAVEAQPHGGRLRVTGSLAGNLLTLWFEDSGPGIPPEKRAALFDFSGSTKPGGSGIGLPLSQLIIQAHRGNLHYEEQAANSSGAKFRLSLPLSEKEA